MSWIAAIDVPMLTRSAVLAVDVLVSLHGHKIPVLYRHELYCVGLNWLFDKILSEIEIAKYNDEIAQIAVKPNIDDVNLNPEEGKEIKNQLITLHGLTNDIRLYVIETKRIDLPTPNLTTTIDGVDVNHHLICVDKSKDVDSYLDKNTPTLNQLKHHQFNHVLGGKSVSKFSAYDKNDETDAISLLKKSYDDYQGEIDPLSPPKHLFTWDSKHKCYVCFHNSEKWEYHGHDVEITDSKIPTYIKQKYHHFK